jgi:hypothetical protein
MVVTGLFAQHPIVTELLIEFIHQNLPGLVPYLRCLRQIRAQDSVLKQRPGVVDQMVMDDSDLGVSGKVFGVFSKLRDQ